MQTAAVHQVIPFVGKANQCPKRHAQLHCLCCVTQSNNMHSSFPALHQIWKLSQCQQNPVPLQFPLPGLITTINVMPCHLAFYFWILVYLIILHRLVRAYVQCLHSFPCATGHCANTIENCFCLSGTVVALHLENSSSKAKLCSWGGTVSLFLSRLACCILNLVSKHGITLITTY